MPSRHDFTAACGRGDLELAKEYLANNPTLRIREGHNHALHMACMNGHMHVIEWLLSLPHGFSFAGQNERALGYAIKGGQTEVVRMILTARAGQMRMRRHCLCESFSQLRYCPADKLDEVCELLRPYLVENPRVALSVFYSCGWSNNVRQWIHDNVPAIHDIGRPSRIRECMVRPIPKASLPDPPPPPNSYYDYRRKRWLPNIRLTAWRGSHSFDRCRSPV